MSEFHANVAQTQTVEDSLGISTNELQSQIVSQATTIESLRMLLHQAQVEIDALRCTSVFEPCDMTKENTSDRNFPRMHEVERRLRASELKNNRLAMEVRHCKHLQSILGTPTGTRKAPC